MQVIDVRVRNKSEIAVYGVSGVKDNRGVVLLHHYP
jgi:hypothetical protein